jgi:hypothetical protein
MVHPDLGCARVGQDSVEPKLGRELRPYDACRIVECAHCLRAFLRLVPKSGTQPRSVSQPPCLSCGAATDSSPRRESWVSRSRGIKSRDGTKESFGFLPPLGWAGKIWEAGFHDSRRGIFSKTENGSLPYPMESIAVLYKQFQRHTDHVGYSQFLP